MAHGKSSFLAAALLVIAASALRVPHTLDSLSEEFEKARIDSKKISTHSQKDIMHSNKNILRANNVASHGRCDECVEKKDSCFPERDSTSQTHQSNASIYQRLSGSGLFGVMLFGSNELRISKSLGCFRDTVFSYDCIDCNGDCIPKEPRDNNSTWGRRGINLHAGQQERYNKMYYLLASCASKSLYQNKALLSEFPNTDPSAIREQWAKLGIDEMMEVDQNESDSFPLISAAEVDQMMKVVREAKVKKIMTKIKEIRTCMAPWMLVESFGTDVMGDLKQLVDAFNSARYRVFPTFAWPPQ